MVSKVVAQQMLFQVKCRGEMQTEQFWQHWQLVSAWFDACNMFYLPKDATKWWPQHCMSENGLWHITRRGPPQTFMECRREDDSQHFESGNPRQEGRFGLVCSAESQREKHVCNCLFRGTGHQCFLPFKIWWGQCSLNVSIYSSRYVWESQQKTKMACYLTVSNFLSTGRCGQCWLASDSSREAVALISEAMCLWCFLMTCAAYLTYLQSLLPIFTFCGLQGRSFEKTMIRLQFWGAFRTAILFRW